MKIFLLIGQVLLWVIMQPCVVLPSFYSLGPSDNDFFESLVALPLVSVGVGDRAVYYQSKLGQSVLSYSFVREMDSGANGVIPSWRQSFIKSIFGRCPFPEINVYRSEYERETRGVYDFEGDFGQSLVLKKLQLPLSVIHPLLQAGFLQVESSLGEANLVSHFFKLLTHDVALLPDYEERAQAYKSDDSGHNDVSYIPDVLGVRDYIHLVNPVVGVVVFAIVFAGLGCWAAFVGTRKGTLRRFALFMVFGLLCIEFPVVVLYRWAVINSGQ